jgi:hypothetical protein
MDPLEGEFRPKIECWIMVEVTRKGSQSGGGGAEVSGVVDGSSGVVGSRGNWGLVLHPAVATGVFCWGMWWVSLLVGLRELSGRGIPRLITRKAKTPVHFISFRLGRLFELFDTPAISIFDGVFL